MSSAPKEMMTLVIWNVCHVEDGLVDSCLVYNLHGLSTESVWICCRLCMDAVKNQIERVWNVVALVTPSLKLISHYVT